MNVWACSTPRGFGLWEGRGSVAPLLGKPHQSVIKLRRNPHTLETGLRGLEAVFHTAVTYIIWVRPSTKTPKSRQVSTPPSVQAPDQTADTSGRNPPHRVVSFCQRVRLCHPSVSCVHIFRYFRGAALYACSCTFTLWVEYHSVVFALTLQPGAAQEEGSIDPGYCC